VNALMAPRPGNETSQYREHISYKTL